MTPDELIQQLETNLDAVPYIVGVNNHMGSKITTHSDQIYQIFSILKKRNLFFIDSRTTNKSVCRPSARLFRIPFAERSVFLDNNQDETAIKKQIDILVKIANRDGYAIGIGHPHKITCRILKAEHQRITREVSIVPASRLVRIIES